MRLTRRIVVTAASVAITACTSEQPPESALTGLRNASGPRASTSVALQASISGLSTTNQFANTLYTAQVSGGVPPYTYSWRAFGAGVSLTDVQTETTGNYYGTLLVRPTSAGSLNLELTVTDVTGASVFTYCSIGVVGSGTFNPPDCLVTPRAPGCSPNAPPR